MTCHDYCRNAQFCRISENVYCDPERCFESIRWDDMRWDAECMRGEANVQEEEEAERE